MIPSRGLRWSGQTSSIGRRRLENLSTRPFSSSTVHNGSSRPLPLISNRGALASKASARPQMLRASPLVAIGFSKRFQSTSPALNTPTADAVSGSARAPEWASASSNASFENIDLSSSSLLEIPEQIGYLKSLGLDYGWGPTACVEWLLEHVHVLSGMPWYGSIIATALLVRVAMFYPYVGAADNAARLASVQHLTKPLTVKMQDATRANDTAMAMSIRREISKVHAQAGIKLWKTFTPVMQMFVGYGTFVLLRGMGNLPVPGLETGGALWFQNLAVPDPYFLLPVATAGVLHWVLRRGGETGVNNMSVTAIKALSYGLPTISVLFTWWLPAGLQLSFFISGIASYAQAQTFRSAAFRRWAGMYPLPTKMADPFTKPVETPLYQERVIVARKDQYRDITSQGPKYEAPRSASSGGIFSGLSGMADAAKKNYASVKKTASETMGQGKKVDGKRTKQELHAAAQYEEKRQKEEKQKLAREDERRRAERAERTAAKRL